MVLSRMTWPEVEALSRDIVVLIPTGSLEQHGPHLPLFTDTLIATAVSERVEQALPSKVLLTPTLWLGASAHHLKFPGTLSASFETYMGAIEDAVESLRPHGFWRFYIVNGHGGNNEPNGVVMRKLKQRDPNLSLGFTGYYQLIVEETAGIMEGPIKQMQHACEAEASLMMHLHPDLVRRDKLRDDGLVTDPPLKGMLHDFSEMTEQGSYGYATLATAEKGKAIFEAAVKAAVNELDTLANGYVLKGR